MIDFRGLDHDCLAIIRRIVFPVKACFLRALLTARAWVLFIVLLIAALVAYYILADRYTPFTTEAYVQAYVIQMAPRVEGQVVQVHVRENQAVKKADLLFEIDPRPFQHRVDLLVAKRVHAVKQVTQMEAELSAAKAEDTRLIAEEDYARVVHDQEKSIFKQEATTDRKYVEAVQKHKAAQAALERSRAQVGKVEQALAARVGEDHALVAEVEAQLAEARLNLDWTRVSPRPTATSPTSTCEGSYIPRRQAGPDLYRRGPVVRSSPTFENQPGEHSAGNASASPLNTYPGRVFPGWCGQIGRGG